MKRLLAIFFLLVLCKGTLLGAYRISFEGAVSSTLLTTIKSVSRLETEKNSPPPTFFILKKWGESDKQNLIQVLHAYGFFEGDIDIEYLGEFPDVLVSVQIKRGPQYYFDSLSICDEQNMPISLSPSSLDLKVGCPALSEVILNTEDQILEQLACCGYPLAALANREVVVDQATKRVSVTYSVSRGPLAYFGPVIIEGTKAVKDCVIYRHIYWKEGELFNPNKVACTDASLIESGLFSIITVAPADQVDERGNLPMLIRVEEKQYRHIGAGVSYSTDESVGAMFQWGDENLTGFGDALSFIGEYSEVIKRGTLLYAIPNFFSRNQDLLHSLEVRREDTPGFTEREFSFLSRINRKVNDFFSFNYGVRYERLINTKAEDPDNYHLLNLPVQLLWDTSNRLLNPTSGTTILYFFTPYQAFINSNISFLKQEALLATYQSITRGSGVIFAFSAQVGSIVGQHLLTIPASKRFYAGSSTGLRGYKYLTVSPLIGTKPIGGRSLMIFQIEPRVRVWNKLYLAGFYDFGNVYATSFPNFSEKLLTSIGCGFRYLTAVGPFRVDIAFPLNKRKGIDKSFQIYASIGQTF
ncbi:MAG: BamA/TamA family outer membrane protein [Chlamydiales bacterium]